VVERERSELAQLKANIVNATAPSGSGTLLL
jgi:hypothetical protein